MWRRSDLERVPDDLCNHVAVTLSACQAIGKYDKMQS